MEKLCLTGTETLLGENLQRAWHDRWNLATTTLGATGAGAARCELDDPREIDAWIAAEAPRWIVHCGPAARSTWDADAFEVEIAREAQRVAHLGRAALAHDVRLCVIVGDGRFTGPHMFHEETAPALNRSAAAELYRAVEQAAVAVEGLVIRSHVYGWSSREEASFAERVFQQLVAGTDCPVDPDRYATPILAGDFAELLHDALAANWQGVWHITGAERASQRRFAAELAVVFGLTGKQVPLVSPQAVGLRRRIEETSLNTRRARIELGRPMPMLREGLVRFAEQATSDGHVRLDTLGNAESQLARAA